MLGVDLRGGAGAWAHLISIAVHYACHLLVWVNDLLRMAFLLTILLVATFANELVFVVQRDGIVVGINGVRKHRNLHLARLVLDRMTLPVTDFRLLTTAC